MKNSINLTSGFSIVKLAVDVVPVVTTLGLNTISLSSVTFDIVISGAGSPNADAKLEVGISTVKKSSYVTLTCKEIKGG